MTLTDDDLKQLLDKIDHATPFQVPTATVRDVVEEVMRLREQVQGMVGDPTLPEHLRANGHKLMAAVLQTAKERDAARRDLAEAVATNDALLTELWESHEALRDGCHVIADWPADTVLGEGGVQAIRQLAKGLQSLGCRLANYTDKEIRAAVYRHHVRIAERRKALLAKHAQEARPCE